MKKFVIAATLVALLICAQAPVLAQQKQGSGFRVSPVRDELVIEKGKTQTKKIRVMNLSQVKTTADVVINDFDPSDDESGQPRILMGTNTTTLGNSFKKIASTTKTITLEPRETKELDIKITIPQDANPGGYYGVLRFADSSDPQKSNVSLAASVGTLFLVTVPGDLTEKLNLVEFTAAKNNSNGRYFINGGDMSIIVRLKNVGNIHVKPFGLISIADSRGKVIESYDLNSTEPRSNILPNSTRKFDDRLKNKSWLGKYTITANLGYGSSGGLITAKKTFWVIPSWIIFAGVAVLLIIIIISYLVYRKIKGSKHTYGVHGKK